MIQPYSGFWEKIPRPIIGLSPMDGVTDFAFRAMVAQYGRPDVLFTEFTTAEGLFYAPERILLDFEYSEIERPIVAQIYGHRPDDFYRATLVVCELGFDGIDINMGCPAKQVTKKNCGAKLITSPDLALEILRATRQATEDWSRGETMARNSIPEAVIAIVVRMNSLRVGLKRPVPRRLIPTSVKTRIGYDSVVIEKWVEILLRERPAVISIHGRTLKQMYKGAADWAAIGRAAAVAQGSGTAILGNGDLTSLEQAARAIRESGVDGVLIGRSSIGNPWIFRQKELFKKSFKEDPTVPIPLPSVDRTERIRLCLEHANLFEKRRGLRAFPGVKKHLAGYLSHFPDAALLRRQAMETKNFQELACTLEGYCL